MAVYFLAHFTVTDKERYHLYEKGFFPILKQYDARFITYDDDPLVLEGSREDGRSVLIEFANKEELRRWWESEEYVELAVHRHASTKTHAVYCLKGLPPRT